MKKRIVSRNKDTRITMIIRAKKEKEAEVLKKEFQKMIRKCNHLLETEIGYELIITKSDKHNHPV